MKNRPFFRFPVIIALPVLLILILAGILGLVRPFGGKSSPPAHILLITIDTLRADRLGCTGYVPARTPYIDRLAAGGVLCTDSAAAAPITLPAHTTILTGLLPPAHGVRDNGAFSLGDGAITLAERLKKAGFQTQAFVSALVLNRRYNLVQGFDGYDDDLWGEEDPKLFMIRDRPAKKTIDRVLAWFKNRDRAGSKKPFFLWVHLFDPHQPYQAPTWARVVTPTPYDAEIATVDRELGRLFAYMKKANILDNTLVFLTADHGESLGEHNEKTHAIFIYDATIRVPLIIRYPKLFPAGRTYTGPVHQVDIVPTILSALDLPGGSQTQGIDLLPYLGGGKKPVPRAQYCESRLSELGFGMAPLYGLRKDGYKWIRAPKPELYDLGKDPGELANIIEQDQALGQKLDRELSQVLSGCRRFAIPVKDNPMTRETEEMLQSLGYLAPKQERAGMAGMDPKDGIFIYNKLEQARHLAQSGQWAETEVLLREILTEIPGHLSARNILALVLLKQGKSEEAKEEYSRSLKDDPSQSRVYAMLGNLFLLDGELDRAEIMLKKALDITPQFVEAMSNLGMIALLRGNEEEAGRWYRKALVQDPGFPHVYRRLADLYYDNGEFSPALDHYRKTLAHLPGDFRSLIQAGNCARRLKQMDQAESYFRKAGEINPDSWIPFYNLACLKAAQGEAAEGLKLLQKAIDAGLDSADQVEKDPDFISLRPLKEFTAILSRLEKSSRAGR